MEMKGARRTFPCFDEPDMKAEFAITIVYQDPYLPVTNMPSVDVEVGLFLVLDDLDVDENNKKVDQETLTLLDLTQSLAVSSAVTHHSTEDHSTEAHSTEDHSTEKRSIRPKIFLNLACYLAFSKSCE